MEARLRASPRHGGKIFLNFLVLIHGGRPFAGGGMIVHEGV